MRDDDQTNNLCSIPKLLREADMLRQQPQRTMMQRFLAWLAGIEVEPEITPNPRVIETCSECGVMYTIRALGSFVPESGKCYRCETGHERPAVPTQRQVARMRAGESLIHVPGSVTNLNERRAKRLRGER